MWGMCNNMRTMFVYWCTLADEERVQKDYDGLRDYGTVIIKTGRAKKPNDAAIKMMGGSLDNVIMEIYHFLD